MKNKKANALISWIMIITIALVSALITTYTPLYISRNTDGVQDEYVFIQKRIEVMKKKMMAAKKEIEARKKKIEAQKDLFMKKGIYAIEEFFNPNSRKYFGIKMNSFYEEANLKRVKSIIEGQAKAQGRRTKDVMNEVTAREFIKYVFSDLEQELKNIASNYNNQIKLDEKLMAEVSNLDVAIVMSGGMIASLGVSAAVLAAYGAMTAQVTGLWAALVIWWTGASVGWGGATAAILSGPWGWIILGCAIVAMYYGYDYYKKEAERQICVIKENLKVVINANKAIMINNWKKLFN